MRVRVRRRLLTPRRLVVLAVIGAVGGIVAVVIGHTHEASSSATPTALVPTTVPCRADDHSAVGATVTAIEGLHQLALANLGPVDVSVEHTAQIDQVLERYVTAERRPLMRQYLHTYPAPFRDIATTVLATQTVAYSPVEAHVRLATVDVATTTAGTQETTRAVTDVTVSFDATQNFWRLADWKVDATGDVADVVTSGEVPCK